MKILAIPASWPLRRPVFAPGIVLALLFTGALNAASPTPPNIGSLLTSYVGANEGIYRLHSTPGGRTSNEFSLDGHGILSLDPLYSLQLDASYSRLSPGGGLPGSNAWLADAHFNYKIDDIPVGAFLGAYKNGPTTWAGGIEGTLPLKLDWVPPQVSSGGDPLVNWQGFYGRTHNTGINHWGGTAEMRMYPCDDTRVSLHAGYKHTSSSLGGFKFSDNIWSFGIGAGYMFPCGWILYGDYEHTHFNSSGLGVEGFTFGLHYCFGGKRKIRDAEVRYLDLSRMLGVQTKF